MDWRERPFFSWDNAIAALDWAQEENVDLWVCSAEIFDLYQMRDASGMPLAVDMQDRERYWDAEQEWIFGRGAKPPRPEPRTLDQRRNETFDIDMLLYLCSLRLRYHSFHHWLWETAPDRGKAVKVHLGTCQYETLADT